MKFLKIACVVALICIASVSKPFVLSQLFCKYSYQGINYGFEDETFTKNKNPINRNIFYPLCILLYLAETKIELATPLASTKLQNYNPVLKGHSNIALERIFQRLLIIRKIKVFIEEQTKYSTQWHIETMKSFNAFARKDDHGALVFITEEWLTSEKLTDEQFEKYLTAILLHELGHVFLNHTQKQHYIANTIILSAINLFLYTKDVKNKNCLPWEVLAFFVERAAVAMASRQFEFQADAFAAQFVPGSDLKEALEFITGTNDRGGIFKSHPTTLRRGQRLVDPTKININTWSDSNCYKWW